MGHERPVDDYRWLWTARPRRLNLGDLMFGVALAALGCLILTLVFRSELGDGPRGLRPRRPAPLRDAGRAVEARRHPLARPALDGQRPPGRRLLCPRDAHVRLPPRALAALFPDGAALVVITLVVAAIYLSTWD